MWDSICERVLSQQKGNLFKLGGCSVKQVLGLVYIFSSYFTEGRILVTKYRCIAAPENFGHFP